MRVDPYHDQPQLRKQRSRMPCGDECMAYGSERMGAGGNQGLVAGTCEPSKINN